MNFMRTIMRLPVTTGTITKLKENVLFQLAKWLI